MKKFILLSLFLITIMFTSACSELGDLDLSQLSEEDIDKVIKCEDPYIRYAAGCCLDENANSICDEDELDDHEHEEDEEEHTHDNEDEIEDEEEQEINEDNSADDEEADEIEDEDMNEDVDEIDEESNDNNNDSDGNDEEECLSEDGIWGLGQNGNYFCNFPTTDAGVECTDSNQCESYCEAPEDSPIGEEVTGECYGFSHAVCMQEVKNGIAENTWCE